MSDRPQTALQVMKDAHQHHRCWSCGDMRAEHFCSECGRVQPAEPTDYFSFFGLERKLQLKEADLEREYFALSRKLHPDVYSRASTREQLWSLEKTSQLNDAYRTLKDPISRTVYLLKLEGIQLEEQSKTATEEARSSGVEKKQAVPPDLLEEAFELNMLLEEARMDSSDEDVRAQLKASGEQLTARLKALKEKLHEAWKQWDAGDSTATASMVDVLNRRKYMRNLARDIHEVLQ